MTDLSVMRVPAPVWGMDLASAPDSIPDTCAAWMENFLPAQPGRVPVRRQHARQSDALHPSHARRLANAFNTRSDAAYPHVTRVTGGTVLPDRAPYAPVSVDENAGTTLATGVSYRAVGGAATQLDYPIWGRVVPSGTGNFAFAMNDGVNTTYDAGLEGPLQHTRPLLWIPAQSDAPTITSFGLDNAPHTGVDLAIHLNRPFVLGGYPPTAGGEEWSSSCLFFMEDDLTANGEPATGTAEDWKRDGVVNRINIPGDDRGVAVVPLNTSLVIFKRRSIWALYGSSPESFTLRRVEMGTGCYDANSIVEADGGLYFASERGLQFFDGVAVVSCSDSVAPYFEHDPDFIHPDGLVASETRCSAFAYGEEWLVVHMAVQSDGLFSDQKPVLMVMHRSTRTWTAFSGDDVLDELHYDEPLFAAGTRWVHGGGVFHQPQSGSPTPPTREWRRGQSFRPLAAYARMTYKRRVLGGVDARAQLRRVGLNTKYEGAVRRDDEWFLFRGLTSAQESFPDADTPTEGAIWATGITGDAKTTAPGIVDEGAARFRNGQYTSVDVRDEVDDVIFDVIFESPDTPTTRLAEVYDGSIEYQTTHARTTIQPRRTSR